MIFYGRYRYFEGTHRPYFTSYILSSDGTWKKCIFLIDSGADVTFLPYGAIQSLEIDTSKVTIKDDVGGVGGYGIPYFEYETKLKFVGEHVKVFGGTVNIFLDIHATDVALLGRDVLDEFVVIFDRRKGTIMLLDEECDYEIRKVIN